MSNTHDAYTLAAREVHSELKDALLFSSRLLVGSPLLVRGEPVLTGLKRWKKFVLSQGKIFKFDWLALEHLEDVNKLVQGAEFTMEMLSSVPAEGGYMASEVRRSRVLLFDRLERLRGKLARVSDLLLAVDYVHREMVRYPLLRMNYLSKNDQQVFHLLTQSWKTVLENPADEKRVEAFLLTAQELLADEVYNRILQDRTWSSTPEFRAGIEKRLLALEALLLLE